MKKHIRDFERFCLRHRDKGIPNLMMYIAAASAVVFLISLIDPSAALYNLLSFNRVKILHGELWRLVTFLIAPAPSRGLWNGFVTLLMLFFYYRIGLMLEQRMGTFKFNLFYFFGALLVALSGLLFGWVVTSDSLHMSLVLAFSALYAEARVMLFYLIPLKIKYLAWFYLIITGLECLGLRTLLPLIPLLNFFIFFYAELPNLLPDPWKHRKSTRAAHTHSPSRRPSPNWADGYQSKSGQKPYHHKCTVCGRTDTEYPDMEFRYCSRCKGYYCYCMDHINNHAHIE